MTHNGDHIEIRSKLNQGCKDDHRVFATPLVEVVAVKKRDERGLAVLRETDGPTLGQRNSEERRAGEHCTGVCVRRVTATAAGGCLGLSRGSLHAHNRAR